MKKRVFALLCATVTAMSCAGCGSDSSETSGGNNSSIAETTTAAEPNVTTAASGNGENISTTTTKPSELIERLLMNDSYYAEDRDVKGNRIYWILKLVRVGNSVSYTKVAYSDLDTILKTEEGIPVQSTGMGSEANGVMNMSSTGGTDQFGNISLSDISFLLSARRDGAWMDNRSLIYVAGNPWGDVNTTLEEPEVLFDWNDASHWHFQVEDGADATTGFSKDDNDHTVEMNITVPGPNPWSSQAKFRGMKLEQGCKYRISFEYQTDTRETYEGYDPSGHHALISIIQDYDPYSPYFEDQLPLNMEEWTPYSKTFVMRDESDERVFCAFSFGALGGTFCYAKIRHFKFEKLSG